ncbi:hypothetical protein ACTFIW_009109 [Dictyostelium discoideum]
MQKFDAFLVYSYLPLLPLHYEPFIYLYDKTTTFGRGKKSDVEFLSMSASREHSKITVEISKRGYKEYFIEDSDTLNGTFINGVRIEIKTKLRHNDRIRFGSNSSEVRYTFKFNYKLSFENINIFKFLKSLENDKQKLKSHPLSKLFTPLLVASDEQEMDLKDENNIDNNNNNNNNIIDNNIDNNNNNMDNNIDSNNNSNIIKKKNLENEKIKKLQVNETPSNKTNISTSLNKSAKKTITKTPKTINKKRKHEEIHKEDEENEEDEEMGGGGGGEEEEEKEEEKEEEEKTEIIEKDSLVQFILADKSCNIGTVISYNKNKNSYLIQRNNYLLISDSKRIQINNGEIEKAYVKRLEFEKVNIKSRVRIFQNEKWYRGVILEKRYNSGGRIKYEYLVRLIDIKQPHIWIGGSKIFKE